MTVSRKTLAKRFIGKLIGVRPRRRARRVALIYHAIGSGPLSIPTDRFQEQIVWLARNADIVTLDNLLADGEHFHSLRVALTFDDGYASVATHAAPILSRERMVGTVYLNTACIGTTQPKPSIESQGHYPGEQFLVWTQVQDLCNRGWTIGSHGDEHVDLTRLSDTETRAQLERSKAAIEACLPDTVCRHFAYTWGHYDQRVRTSVARCGYEFAVSGLHGTVPTNYDRYAIPRIDIRSDYELEDFIAVVSGEWDYLGLSQKVKQLIR